MIEVTNNVFSVLYSVHIIVDKKDMLEILQDSAYINQHLIYLGNVIQMFLTQTNEA